MFQLTGTLQGSKTGRSHQWLRKGRHTVRTKCGAIESGMQHITKAPLNCPVCTGAKVVAVAVGDLALGTTFTIDLGAGPVIGVLEALPDSRAYAKVLYALPKGGKEHRFRDKDGKVVDFVDGGFRRAEWSAGTPVRPLMEDAMSDTATSLVESAGGAAPSKAEIRAKVAQLKSKAAAPKAVAKSAAKGKAAPAAKREPKVREQNPCTCACGETTGGRFAPGHDARYYGWLKKIAAGTKEFKELPKSVQKALVDIKGVRKALAEHAK